MKKIVIFDMDGTLFNNVETAYANVSIKQPRITRGEFLALYAENYHDAIVKYQTNNPPIQLTPEQQEQYDQNYALKKAHSKLFSGIHNLLEKLYNDGIILVLNTSAYERNALPQLEQTGIKKFFDLIGTVELSKSKIEKFNIILEKYNVTKDDVLFVTDAVGDVKEASVLDIPTIGVTWGIHDREYLNREHYNNLITIVDTVKELKDYIYAY